MPDRHRRDPPRFIRGTERARKFFSLFGIRSARMEREESDNSDDE